MRPGISTSASSISLRPNSARERSATLKSEDSVAAAGSIVVVNGETPSSWSGSPDVLVHAATDMERVGPDHRMTARRPDRWSRVADANLRGGAGAPRERLASWIWSSAARATRRWVPSSGVVSTGFGMAAPDENDEYPIHLLPAERSLAVTTTTPSSRPRRVPVPDHSARRRAGGGGGGDGRDRPPDAPAAGTPPADDGRTARRRGVRGEPLAALTASEASIYERFGYGTATFTTQWDLASEYASTGVSTALAAAGFVWSRVRLPSPGGTRRLRRRHDRARGRARTTGGMVAADLHAGKKGARFFTAVHEGSDGRPNVLALRTRSRLARRRAGLDAAGDRAPGRRRRRRGRDVDVPLRHRPRGDGVAVDRPVDDPLRWRLEDARRLRVRQLRDHLWIRIVDVAAAVGRRRTYATDDALVVELVDGFRPSTAAGGWWTGVPPAPCACVYRRPPIWPWRAELVRSTSAEAGVDVGGAGRVRELTSGAVTRADRFFTSLPSPRCATHFGVRASRWFVGPARVSPAPPSAA